MTYCFSLIYPFTEQYVNIVIVTSLFTLITNWCLDEEIYLHSTSINKNQKIYIWKKKYFELQLYNSIWTQLLTCTADYLPNKPNHQSLYDYIKKYWFVNVRVWSQLGKKKCRVKVVSCGGQTGRVAEQMLSLVSKTKNKQKKRSEKCSEFHLWVQCVNCEH